MVALEILIYDKDNKKSRKLEKLIQNIGVIAKVVRFENVVETLEYAKVHNIEVAFVSMKEVNGEGYFLARKLKKLCPYVNLIAISDKFQYGDELMKLRISGYILSEPTEQLIAEEITNLRYY